VTPAVGRLFNSWVFTLSGIGTVWIFLLMLLINADILSRFLFSVSIHGVTEIVELSIVGIVFLQLADAVASGRLISSDGLFSKIVAGKPRVGHALGVVFDLGGVAFFGAILAGVYPLFVESYQRDYFAGTEGIFAVPLWPLRLLLVICCITIILVFLKLVWRHLAGILNPHGAHS
jgi:TRAP-type C4-dicarboxylate transport system permease small subunit